MNYKRLIMSGGMLAFVGAVVIGGTGAFFSSQTASTGNVFTAGSVSLALAGYTHQYLVDGQAVADPVANYFVSPAPNGTTSSFAFNDLKPLDNGTISGTLTNGANDAFICARITGFEEESPFRDMLAFRTGTGPGGSFGEIVDALPINTWFTPVPPSLLPMNALALNAGQFVPVAIQYCFGEFVQGGGCQLVSGLDYNPAQNQELSIDIEYYAVQQRNNVDFTCASLNVPFSFSHNADEDNELEGNPEPEPVRVNSLGSNNNPGLGLVVGSTMTVGYAFPGQEFTLDISNGGDDYEFVVNMPYAVTGDASMSIFFDTNNDGVVDFQYEFNNSGFPDQFLYKENQLSSYVVETEPLTYSSNESVDQVFTFSIPKSEFSSTFRVAVNGTQNNNPVTGTHVQVGIPVANIFANGFFTSQDYLVVTP